MDHDTSTHYPVIKNDHVLFLREDKYGYIYIYIYINYVHP